jgi:iron complex outermembrane receptor protein
VSRPLNLLTLLTALPLSAQVSAQASDGQTLDLAELSLEELMNLEVVITSASRHEELLADAAASVFVLTSDQIERSGATSIPELLRLVPGVEVARIDSNRWAVSIRGFNEQFANKLLVLVDGRSVYTPLFSGTFWDQLDIPLGDIERIEVVRGPGAPLWGANAVNGVIHILTRHTRDEPHRRVSVTSGDLDRALVDVRLGDADERGGWRAWARLVERDETLALDGSRGEDDWSLGHIGFRTDRRVGERDELLFQGDAYDGTVHNDFLLSAPPPQYLATGRTRSEVRGGSLQFRWTRALANADELVLATALDRTERELLPFDEERTNAFAEVQRRIRSERHDLTLGASVRSTHAAIEDSFQIAFDDEHRTTTRTSLFLQDELTLVPERWSLILGGRLEHEDLVGVYAQPTVRAVFTPDERQTWWCSLSRAVRTPSQAEQDVSIVTAVIPGSPDTYVTFRGDRDVDPETVDALELGYRTWLGARCSLDVTLFAQRYSDLIQFQPGTPEPFGADVLLPFEAANVADADSHGIELVADWLMLDDTHLSTAWTLFDLDLHSSSAATPVDQSAEGDSPSSSLRLWLQHDFDQRWRADAILWRVEHLENADVRGYWRLDANVHRSLGEHGQLSLGLVNLLHDEEPEFGSGIFGPSNEVETNFTVRLVLGS